MNLAHVHLALNHLPVVGAVAGFFLFLAAVARKSDELTKAGLIFFVFAAFSAVPVYFSGEPAEEIVKDMPDVSKAAIEEHEEAAEFASVMSLSLGAVSLGALLYARRKGTLPSWVPKAILALSLATVLAMAWTANLGGLIHHAEIRTGGVEAGHPPGPS